MAAKKKTKSASKKSTAKTKAKAAKTPKALARKAAPRKAAPRKAAPKKRAAKKKVAAKKSAAPARRDATGHLDPSYARDLRARSRATRDDDTRAFLRGSRSKDDLAEELGEEAVATMTSGEDQSERLEAEVDEERGGPFVPSRGRKEFARGTDKSNPRSASREPFPRT
ncbi:MAG: histone protein [Labilithrix sp.]|nr:histone protein [Labilithrix sp.]